MSKAFSCRVSVVELFPSELFVDSDELEHQNYIINSPVNKKQLQELIEAKHDKNHPAPLITNVSRQALSFMDIEKPAYYFHSTVGVNSCFFENGFNSTFFGKNIF